MSKSVEDTTTKKLYRRHFMEWLNEYSKLHDSLDISREEFLIIRESVLDIAYRIDYPQDIMELTFMGVKLNIKD